MVNSYDAESIDALMENMHTAILKALGIGFVQILPPLKIPYLNTSFPGPELPKIKVYVTDEEGHLLSGPEQGINDPNTLYRLNIRFARDANSSAAYRSMVALLKEFNEGAVGYPGILLRDDAEQYESVEKIEEMLAKAADGETGLKFNARYVLSDDKQGHVCAVDIAVKLEMLKDFVDFLNMLNNNPDAISTLYEPESIYQRMAYNSGIVEEFRKKLADAEMAKVIAKLMGLAVDEDASLSAGAMPIEYGPHHPMGKLAVPLGQITYNESQEIASRFATVVNLPGFKDLVTLGSASIVQDDELTEFSLHISMQLLRSVIGPLLPEADAKPLMRECLGTAYSRLQDILVMLSNMYGAPISVQGVPLQIEVQPEFGAIIAENFLPVKQEYTTHDAGYEAENEWQQRTLDQLAMFDVKPSKKVDNSVSQNFSPYFNRENGKYEIPLLQLIKHYSAIEKYCETFNQHTRQELSDLIADEGAKKVIALSDNSNLRYTNVQNDDGHSRMVIAEVDPAYNPLSNKVTRTNGKVNKALGELRNLGLNARSYIEDGKMYMAVDIANPKQNLDEVIATYIYHSMQDVAPKYGVDLLVQRIRALCMQNEIA